MLQTLSHFVYMGGYGLYVWPAYSSVLVALFINWRLASQKSNLMKSLHE